MARALDCFQVRHVRIVTSIGKRVFALGHFLPFRNRLQDIQKRTEMRFVSFPATERSTINGPPHLPAAGSCDGAGRLVRFNASRMPIEAAKGEYLAYYRLRLGHQGFVADTEQMRWDYIPPVSHQLFVVSIIQPDTMKVETVLLAVAKVLKVT